MTETKAAEISAVMGVELILLFRDLDEAKTQPATKMAFQAEHSVEASRDSDTTATKDGGITSSGEVEEEISITTIMARNDPTGDFIERAFYDNRTIEVWEIDRGAKNEKGLYKAQYRQGKVTDYTRTGSTEDAAQIEFTFKTNGKRQKGYTTLSEEQEEIVQYVFRDTEIYTGPENEKNAEDKTTGEATGEATE